MIVLKLYHHLISLVKTLFYRLIYNKSFTMPFSSTYRAGFHVVINKTGGVKIGKHCFFNNYCTLASRAGITIGDGTRSNVIILKGVTIGDNCVIGAGCVIYKDVPDNWVVVNQQKLLMKMV